MSHEDGHEPITWHHGLMARWWAEFNVGGAERARLLSGRDRTLRRTRARPGVRGGPPVGAPDGGGSRRRRGRRLTRHARAGAAPRSGPGLNPTLTEQPISGLDLARRYRTIFICDSFGIGGPRKDDLEGLRRVYAHLVPGGALVLSHHLPYGDEEGEWLRWLPHRHGDTESWPETGDRRTAADGDELELLFRERSWDPLLQRSILEMRARLWRDDRLVREEEQAIVLSAYFAQEIVTMLEVVGFVDVEVQCAYTGEPASSDDTHVVFIASRPA